MTRAEFKEELDYLDNEAQGLFENYRASRLAHDNERSDMFLYLVRQNKDARQALLANEPPIEADVR